MSILAKFEDGNRRRSDRRRLLLQAAGSGPGEGVLIHDISATGMLIETPAALSIGDEITVEIPESGATSARVVWDSGSFYGCRFDAPLSKAALSAALLRAGPPSPDDPRPELSSAAVLELHQLRARVQQLTAQLDRVITELERTPRA